LANYALTPTTWNGTSIQTADYAAWFDPRDDILSTYPVQNIDVQQPNTFPQRVGTQPTGKAYPLHIQLKDKTSTKLLTLQKLFAPGQGQKILLATDGAGGTLRLTCESLGLIDTGNRVEWIARLWATRPLWEKDTATVDTHANCAGNSHAWTATNNGSANAKPKINFTLNAAKNQANDYRYFRAPSILNLTPKPLFDLDGEGWPTAIVSSWDTATLVGLGKCLASGDDCRVFCDGVEVKRWFGAGAYAFNQATTKVWANIPYRAKAAALLTVATTAVVPADGGALSITSIAGFPQSGYVAVGLTSWELIYYNGVVDYGTYGQLLNIKRAQRGTTARAQTLPGIVGWVEHDIRVLYGYSAAVNPPADTTYSPMFDLSTSTNTKWNYITDYLEEGSHRTGQFQRAYKQLNTLSAYLRAYEDSSKMYVEDSAPVAGKPKNNVWWLNVPIGIVGANAIHHDIAVPANMLLDVYGNDGVADQLLAQYNPATDGDGLNITPSAAVFNLQYRAKVRTIISAEPSTAYPDVALGDASNELCQDFTLVQAATVYGFTFRLKKTAGADGNIVLNVTTGGTAGDPDSGALLIYDLTVVAAADLTTSYADYTIMLTTPIAFAAGTYHLIIKRSAATAAAYWYKGVKTYGPCSAWQEVASTWTEYGGTSMWFRVLGDGTVCQPEVPVGSGDECTVDDLELTLTPFSFTAGGLAVIQGSEQNCYHLNGILTVTHPDSTVQTLTLNIPCKVGDEISVDAAAKTITNVTTGELLPLGVVASDGVNWLEYAPGANAVSWAEAGMIDTTIVSTHRDTYAGAGG
jgi:hypothetical protein